MADMMTSQELAALALEDSMLARIESSSEDDDYRPSIADQQKVGFFSQDRATQTTHSEIVDLKEMTDVLTTLRSDAKTLKRELSLAKQVMQADYENKLQEKALDLYCRVNERIDDVERMHDERVGVVRRSFRQQLADALVKVNNDWKKHYGSKMMEDQKREKNKKNEAAEEIKELQMQLQQQESVIHMLKMQLQQYTGQQQEESVSSRSASINPEIQELKTELDKMYSKIGNLEDALDTKDEISEQLNNEIDQLNRELEKERITIQQLLAEKNELSASAEQDKAAIKRQLEKQKLELEKEMQDKLGKARDEVLNLAKNQADELQKREEEKNKQLLDQKKAADALLAKQREEALQNTKSDDDLNQLKTSEKRLRQELAKLRRELDKTNRTWEKKFAILQSSLHAIKDESYLRQTLQKQAATLGHASVTYAADAPVGIMPTSQFMSVQAPPSGGSSRSPRKPGPPGQPLPAIGRSQQQIRDIMSAYTVTPPPGRAAAVFSVGESQIVDANEEIDYDGIIPLPSPPPRIRGDYFEERPPSSHIIVLPSA